ncbi:MAG: hypothetical protein FJW90_07570 [Actinobacteria bacterium]|nr:hypothetical protein [Actinomycetota bacterium]
MSGRPPTGKPVWREDAAIWEIVAGELVAQRHEPVAEAGQEGLAARAGMLGLRAGTMVADDDLDSAGHALIGCSVTLGLAALASEAGEEMSVEVFAAELAATVSWDAERPSVASLRELTEEIAAAADPAMTGPSLWELAVRAGAAAAGLSAHITRRSRSRRTEPAA